MKFLFNVFALILVLGAVNAQYPTCNICNDGEAITKPDAILPQGFAGFLAEDMTCAETQQMATDGGFNIIQCNLFSFADISSNCGCDEVSTPVTPAPVTTAAPTDSPVLTTAAPTDSPIAVPTETPTEAPVSTNVPTSAPVDDTDAPTEAPVSVPTSSPVLETDEPTETPVNVEAPTGMYILSRSLKRIK